MLDVFSLRGTSNRSDWWIVTILGSVIAQVVPVVGVVAALQETGPHWLVFGVATLVSLAALWAIIAVTARRYRDRGESPWMTLLLLVPVVGGIWVVVACGILPQPSARRRRTVVRQVSMQETPRVPSAENGE